eukprot:1877372-Karenia_brevis.AAC.1
MPTSFWNDLIEEKASEMTTKRTQNWIVWIVGKHDDNCKDHKLRISYKDCPPISNKAGVDKAVKDQAWENTTLAERWSNLGEWHVYNNRADVTSVETFDRYVVKN